MKDIVLVDTGVSSYTLKRDSRRVLYESELRGKCPAFSLMPLAELRR